MHPSSMGEHSIRGMDEHPTLLISPVADQDIVEMSSDSMPEIVRNSSGSSEPILEVEMKSSESDCIFQKAHQKFVRNSSCMGVTLPELVQILVLTLKHYKNSGLELFGHATKPNI